MHEDLVEQTRIEHFLGQARTEDRDVLVPPAASLAISTAFLMSPLRNVKPGAAVWGRPG
jgi:hypothetical protein